MKSHTRPKSGLVRLRVHCAALLLISAMLLFRLGAVAGHRTPQPLQQPGQNPLTKLTNKISSPFPLVEEQEIKDFDSLPKDQQETMLATQGPLLPQKSNLNNFSMRAFVKGNSPLFIDYALEPNSSALVTISTHTEEADSSYTLTLLTPESLQDRVRKIELGAPVGDLRQRAIIIGIEVLIREFLLKPEIGRNQVVIDLPDWFGSSPQVGKISIQAFSNGPGDSRPSYFSLYGLAMGEQAITNASSIQRPHPNPELHHAGGHALRGQMRGSTAFDQIILSRSTLTINKREKVNYRIHSRAKFNDVKVVFYRVEGVGHFSIPFLVHTDELGSVVENGWLQPPEPRCEWDGKSNGTPSKGPHDVEVRGWVRSDDRYWASGWSKPKRLQVK